MSSSDLRRALDRSPSGSRASSRAGTPTGSPVGRSRAGSVVSAMSGAPPRMSLPEPAAPVLAAGAYRARSLSVPMIVAPVSPVGPTAAPVPTSPAPPVVSAEHPSPLLQRVLRRSPSVQGQYSGLPPTAQAAPPPLNLSQLRSPERRPGAAPAPAAAVRPSSPLALASQPSPPQKPQPPAFVSAGLAQLKKVMSNPGGPEAVAMWQAEVRAVSDDSSSGSDDHAAQVQQRLDMLRQVTERVEEKQRQQHARRADAVASRIDRLRGLLAVPAASASYTFQ
jgi:hypothetical protein